MFTLEVNTAQAERKFDLSAESMQDLTIPLKRFGGYLRAKALARYEAQNFPPLAEATIMKRAQAGLRSLERKLHRDVRRAMQRARKQRGPTRRGLLDALFTSGAVRRAEEDAQSSQTRGVQNRTAVLAQFQRWHRKGLKEQARGKELSTRQRVSLLQREARAVSRAVGRPILGGLPRTIVFDVGFGTVTLMSETHQDWSEAHNAGETVGRGVKLPKRETIALEPEDLDVLESILKDAALIPFQEGMHGPAY